MTNFIAIIPARYGSTRLPGKPLLDILGKPMIAHVIEKAQSAGAKKVIVATDNRNVFDTVEKFGATACMTREDHESGTERLAEVITQMGIDDNEIVINVQGDEPLAPPSIIRQLADNLANTDYEMATLATPITSWEEVFNPNVVKVVRGIHQQALYFSRATIPWDREHFAKLAGGALGHHSNSDSNLTNLLNDMSLLRHLGIYAYRAGFINKYINLTPSPLEKIELLEQLRVLWHGIALHVDLAKEVPQAGVDTQDDIERVRKYLNDKVRE
ncbi:3-deoxy-manno-octulosonate cytidylyltransferase [Thorsellia kenyensis]|uniref:3-deoxy-manno-octulosonate cytidylyltransferase n=1 Tax=Thorsellia kenyensis TaxID=1549888 RepID=A0ABV6CBE2_9GAMM